MSRLMAGSKVSANLFALLSRGPELAVAGMLPLALFQEGNLSNWAPSTAELEKVFNVARQPDCNAWLLAILVSLLADRHYAAALPLLISLLEHKTPIVREASAGGIKTLADPRAAEALIARLDRVDEKTREEFLETLSKLNYEHPVEFADSAKAASLLGSLMNANVVVRRAAAKALGAMRYADSVDALVGRLQDEQEDVGVRGAAAEALGLIGDVKAIDPLIACLQSSDWSLQGSASRALGAIGISAIPALLQLLSQDHSSRYYALEALAKMGEAVVEPLLTAFLADDGPLAQGAAQGLGRMRDVRAVPHLIAKLDSPEYMMHAHAAYALGEIGGPEAIEILSARRPTGDFPILYGLLQASLPILDETDRALLSAQYDGIFARPEYRHHGSPGCRSVAQTRHSGRPCPSALRRTRATVRPQAGVTEHRAGEPARSLIPSRAPLRRFRSCYTE